MVSVKPLQSTSTEIKSSRIKGRFQSGFSRYAFMSDYLTDFYTGKKKKVSSKNCPQSGFNPGPLDYHSNALLTVLAWYVLAR